MPIAISISRSTTPNFGGSAGEFTVIFPNGNEVDVVQTIQDGGAFGTRYFPAIATCDNCEGGIDGIITKARPSGQTFNYSNLLNRNQIQQLSVAGISSFDNNLSAYTSLQLVCVGQYVTSSVGAGQFSYGLSNYGTNRISSFTTRLPAASAGANSNYGAAFVFTRNTVPCSFNPIFGVGSTNASKWTFSYNNNTNQTSLTINAQEIKKIGIYSNPQLVSLTINDAKFLTNITGYVITITGQAGVRSRGVSIISNASLTTIQINGLGEDQITTETEINFDLFSNSLSESTFQSSNLTYSTIRNMRINLSSNKFVNFTSQLNNPKIIELNLSSQGLPSRLQTINDNTISPNLQILNFSTNSVTQCPYLPAGINTVNIFNNPIVCQPDRPNFRSSLVNFTMGGNTSMDFNNWSPNTITPNNEGLQNCNLLQSFVLVSSNLTQWTHQFPTINPLPATSILNLGGNRLQNLDASKLTGFREVDLRSQKNGSTYTLQSMTNLNLNTNVQTLQLGDNKAWNGNSSSSIINNLTPWPPQLSQLYITNSDAADSNITIWTKSFAGFATAVGNPVMGFYWNCPPTTDSINSVSFILRDLISATTKTSGTLRFGYVSPVSGALIGMIYPLGSQDNITSGCFYCLTAALGTPCGPQLVGINALQNTGRGFNISFAQVT